MTLAANELLARLTEIRATDPGAVQKALARREYEQARKKEERYF